MKAVILAGGLGTRISEETITKPKPMVEIGGMPILWHIMKTYSYYGINEFVICLGYKGYYIKEFFANYFLHRSDITVDLKTNSIEVHETDVEPWKVTLVDTGDVTMTGGRINRIKKYVEGETFMLTYGDGVADLNIKNLLDFHNKNNKLCTVTTVQAEGRFGILKINKENEIKSFTEKPKNQGSWINAGYMVCEPGIFDFIKNGDESIWEKEPLQNMAVHGHLNSFKHDGFWKPMDSLNDKNILNELWKNNLAKWKVWK